MSSNRIVLGAAAVASVLSLIAIARTINNGPPPIARAEVPALVKEALTKNPDMIMQALQKMRSKQEQDSKKDVKGAFEKYHAELFNDAGDPSAGNSKNPDVTIVEFFDYHCGYCKKMLPEFQQLVKEDKGVHVIFREFPILSDDSALAARAALAFNKLNPNKYFEFHTALMESKGRFDEKMLGDTAQKFGVSREKLKAEMDKPEITAMLDRNHKLAEEFGVRGTPALLVNNQLLPGAISYDDLKKLVADTRAAQEKKKG